VNDLIRTPLACWAIEHGKPECLQVCHESGKVDTVGTISAWAVYYGNLACLRLAYENGDKWNELTARQAASRGTRHYSLLLFTVIYYY
jgi:hypothetical protein